MYSLVCSLDDDLLLRNDTWSCYSLLTHLLHLLLLLLLLLYLHLLLLLLNTSSYMTQSLTGTLSYGYIHRQRSRR
jgi:hypothetical protein